MEKPSWIGQLTALPAKLLRLYHPENWRSRGLTWAAGIIVMTAVVVSFVLMVLWGQEPEPFSVRAAVPQQATDKSPVTGSVTAATLARAASTLLDKPGGYLSNDVMPPGLFMDNLPNWEFGVLVQVRDLARAMRNEFSRSQSQSVEDKDLSEAEPLFNFDNASWLFPPSETQYRDGIRAIERYARRLAEGGSNAPQFYARADNLRAWLAVAEKRLGSLSQRLSASVGQVRVNTDLAGEAEASQATPAPAEVVVKTPWLEIDDVFYETRGSAWALIHFLRAAEIDFDAVLRKKNALVSLRQIIRELEGTQSAVWSPMVLNGSGFGFVTNYSLIMASYVSRANAAMIDLGNLLSQG